MCLKNKFLLLLIFAITMIFSSCTPLIDDINPNDSQIKIGCQEESTSENCCSIPKESSSTISSSPTSAIDDAYSNDSKIEIAYQEETISESYYLFPQEPAATFNASYPVFEDPRYKDFNEAIVDHEVSAWMKIYDEMCAQADEDIEVDFMLATFNRHLEVTYSVDMVGEDIEVRFYVEWMWTLSNYEPKYWRTYTFSDGMIYATTVMCERVY